MRSCFGWTVALDTFVSSLLILVPAYLAWAQTPGKHAHPQAKQLRAADHQDVDHEDDAEDDEENDADDAEEADDEGNDESGEEGKPEQAQRGGAAVSAPKGFALKTPSKGMSG